MRIFRVLQNATLFRNLLLQNARVAIDYACYPVREWGGFNVKDFQVKYVINHHVVCYEQWLLKMAAETMALKYYPREDNNGAIALGNILNVNSIIDHITIPGTNFVIKTLQKQYSDNELVTFNKVVLKISIAMHENNFANAYMLLTQFINNDFSGYTCIFIS